jgi:hypothetical protein
MCLLLDGKGSPVNENRVLIEYQNVPNVIQKLIFGIAGFVSEFSFSHGSCPVVSLSPSKNPSSPLAKFPVFELRSV